MSHRELQVKRANRAAAFFLFAFIIMAAEPVQACEPMDPEENLVRFREALNRADTMFIGEVQRVMMRRWTDDDQMGLYEQRLLEAQAEGRGLDETERRFVTFSDAEARLSIRTSMKLDGLDQRQPDPIAYFGSPEVDVDLLHPYNNCQDDPRPCPWDIKAGDWVAITLENHPMRAPVTFYCVRIGRPNLATHERIEALRGIVEPAEIFWPFLGGKYGVWPFDEKVDAPPATVSASIRPRHRPTSAE
jgi:hypothetical protein